MKKEQKIYFLLTGEQWLGVALLVMLVLGTLIAVKHFQPKQEVEVSWLNDSTRTDFADYQAKQDSIRKAQWKKKYSRDTITIHMQPFDPNTADSTDFLNLGLPPFVVSNILKYRAKGGKFATPESFARIYGMTDERFAQLKPYIHISEALVYRPDTLRNDSLEHPMDTFPKMFKYSHSCF